MGVCVDCDCALRVEVRASRDGDDSVLHCEDVSADVADLIREAFECGVLADSLPATLDQLHCCVRPLFDEPPVVREIAIELVSGDGNAVYVHAPRFTSGPWARRAARSIAQMKDQHALGPDERVHVLLTAERAARSRPDLVPMLAPPVLRAASLEQAGIRSLGEGSLTAERPVLVSAKMVQEVLHWTADAGAAEIGGATLGQLIVLPQPLPGTRTRVVTVLSACVRDHRHAGEVGLFTFSPEALDEATRIAELRGLGETVITAFHSHGWGSRCGNCNQNPRCPLPDATQLSLRDYELAESLFPSKATLLPVAGRQLGAPGQRPVLTIHGWNGGRMTPFRWQQYHE